jgi:hypothetical protein
MMSEHAKDWIVCLQGITFYEADAGPIYAFGGDYLGDVPETGFLFNSKRGIAYCTKETLELLKTKMAEVAS